MNLNSDFNLFAYKDSNTCKKVLVKVHYNSSLESLKTNNKSLDSIFQKADLNKDGFLQANELNLLNKLANYARTLPGGTDNRGVLEQKQLDTLNKQLKKGKIDINNLPNTGSNAPDKPWSEGLNRNIKTIEISMNAKDTIDNFGTIKEELRQIGEKEGFKVQEQYNGKAPWMEDSKIYRADGKTYVNYYNAADLNNNEEVIRDFEKTNKEQYGMSVARQGAVAHQGSNFAAGARVDSNSKHIGASYLEGGNVLQTLKKDGSAGAVVGEMSLAFTMSAMGLENTVENVQKARETIANDLGISSENLTVVPQYDFHVDMCYRPLGDGQFAVADYDAGIKFLEERLSSNDPKLDKDSPANGAKTMRQDYQEMLERLKSQRDETQAIRQKAEQQLKNDGYDLVKIPCFGNGTNFMNAVGGISNTDGQTFLITNKSDYPEINDMIERSYEQNGVDRVYFVSTKGALNKMGGIDCLTNAK